MLEPSATDYLGRVRANPAYIVEFCMMRILVSLSFTEMKPQTRCRSLRPTTNPQPNSRHIVDIAVCLTFVPMSYPSHFLDGGDVSSAFYEGFRQLGRDTISIEGPDVSGAYPLILVHYSFALIVIFNRSSFRGLIFSFHWSSVFHGEFQALRATQIYIFLCIYI